MVNMHEKFQPGAPPGGRGLSDPPRRRTLEHMDPHAVPSRTRASAAVAVALSIPLVAACTAGHPDQDDHAHARFMANLARHCGDAFPGRLALEPPGDDMLTGNEQLLVHFRDCGPQEVRIPFHVEVEDGRSWDRSRTWYVIRHSDRLELRHDHRREDGSESARTWYGGFSAGEGTPHRQDFLSLERSDAAGVPVGWRIEVVPGVRYSYGTTYDGDYDWRVDFDLTHPLDATPPLPWGHDRDPTRAPGPP
jgi:hypothetical protein